MRISFWFKAIATAFGFLVAAATPGVTQPAGGSPTNPPPALQATVFQMPQMRRQQIAAIRYIRAGQIQRAEKTINETIQQFPQPASNYYILATILVKKNRTPRHCVTWKLRFSVDIAEPPTLIETPTFQGYGKTKNSNLWRDSANQSRLVKSRKTRKILRQPFPKMGKRSSLFKTHDGTKA